MQFRLPRGTQDILPEDQPYWRFVTSTAQEMARRFAYDRIDTPVFEQAGLFERGVGEGTDITEAETIADIAEPLGVDRDALFTAVQDPAIKERLKIETTQALEAGVFGSPFVIIDGEPFWGADRLWMIRYWLKSGGW